MTTQPTSRVPAHLEERYALLRQRGFERHADGWHGNGLEFQIAGSWLQFKTEWPANADPLSDHLDKPGLWKPVRAGRQLRRVFNVQESVVGASEHAALLDETERKPFESVLDWAADTAAGVAPVDWALPGRDAIDACLPKARLTIVHRSYTRQVELIHASGQLALRWTLLSKLPVELPEFRLRWLRALLLEAQDDNHLVRLGLARDRGQTAVVTEIDLTGVPAVLFESMLSTSLDALRWVALLVESADFIAETSTVSRALEICPVTQPNPSGDP